MVVWFITDEQQTCNVYRRTVAPSTCRNTDLARLRKARLCALRLSLLRFAGILARLPCPASSLLEAGDDRRQG